MQGQKTVFVLGAGASMPYGMPSGFGLIERIFRLRDSKDYVFLARLGFTEQQFIRFADELANAHFLSIDRFVESRSEYAEIAKASIATVLLSMESDGQVVGTANFDSKEKENPTKWYTLLWNLLASVKPENFPQRDISVVTFNYDRTLERFLDLAIMSAYCKTGGEAVEMRCRVPIVHVYGNLGELSYSSENLKHTHFATKELLSLNEIQKAAKCIQTISESRVGTFEVNHSSSLIAEADQVVFLGFGFHPENIERLGFPHQKPRLNGSTYGLTVGEYQTAANRLGGRCRLKHFPDMNCHRYFRDLVWP